MAKRATRVLSRVPASGWRPTNEECSNDIVTTFALILPCVTLVLGTYLVSDRKKSVAHAFHCIKAVTANKLKL